ncbi:MAG: hypothetical protein LBQ15_06580 [Clostridium sp.]|nr:hypothetical protein [Clostridium sp.]
MLWYIVIGFLWVCLSYFSIPGGDQASVYQIAVSFAEGNYAAVEPDSYLSSYPQQLGILLFYEFFLRLLHSVKRLISFLPSLSQTRLLLFLRFIQVWAAALFALSGLQITAMTFRRKKVSLLYAFLMAACFPFLLFIDFIYAEMIGFAFMMFGTWMLLRFLGIPDSPEFSEKTSRGGSGWISGSLALLSVTLSVLARKANLIFLVACVVVLVFHAIRIKKYLLLPYAVCLVVFSVSALPLTQAFYEAKAGQRLSGNVPGIAWVAMGLQENENGPGRNNAFNIHTHLTYGYDTARTAAVSRLSIEDSLRKFAADPGYALSFFYEKLKSEWGEPDFCAFAIFAGTLRESAVLNAVYQDGWVHSFLSAFMRWHQLTIYAGAFLSMVFALRRKNRLSDCQRIPLLLFPVAIIGGFFFYLMWEASSRYVLPFFLMAIPQACAGLTALGETLLLLIRNRIRRKPL